MSAYSALRITRTTAHKLWWLSQLNTQPSDEVLEKFLDDYLEERLYNAVIVNDDEELNDDNIVGY